MPVKLTLSGNGFRKGAVCYVNSARRDTELIENWKATVMLTAEDVAYPRSLEVVWENADSGGLKSNTLAVLVSNDTGQKGDAERVESRSELCGVSEDAKTDKTPTAGDGSQNERVLFQKVGTNESFVVPREPGESVLL